MGVPTSDTDKKGAAADTVLISSNAYGQMQAAYWSVDATSYSNKTDALDAIDDLVEAWCAARSAVNALA